MSEIKLSSLFELETVEAGIYRGQSWDLGFRALFGGQVLGQALAAAYETVEAGWLMLHSCQRVHSPQHAWVHPVSARGLGLPGRHKSRPNQQH